MPTDRPAFLYDADCGVCSRFRRIASFLDPSRTVDFLPIDLAAASGLLDPIPPVRRLESSHLVLPDGSVSSGGDSVVGLLRLLPAGRLPAFILSRSPRGLSSTRRAYGIVSRLHGYSCSSPRQSRTSSPLTTAWSSR